MSFQDKLENITQDKNTLLCVGLDSDFDRLPQFIKNFENPQFEFNKAIINTTHDLVCAYKLNSAFYEASGDWGIKQLKMTCDYLKSAHPQIPIILDAKRGDIGSTNEGYVKYAYDYLNVDAITLNPYLGSEALKPFLDIGDRGCFILCKTSNPGSGELQNEMVGQEALYRVVARKVSSEWNKLGNCFLVVGATYPQELTEIRSIVHNMTLLVPGVGVQGADAQKMVEAGVNSKNRGIIIHAARSIIFAIGDETFAKKAREVAAHLRDQFNIYRGTKLLDQLQKSEKPKEEDKKTEQSKQDTSSGQQSTTQSSGQSQQSPQGQQNQQQGDQAQQPKPEDKVIKPPLPSWGNLKNPIWGKKPNDPSQQNESAPKDQEPNPLDVKTEAKGILSDAFKALKGK